MGSKVFASDMLISEMVMPMQQSFTHADYPKACLNLYGLAMFLHGFRQGIEDFPTPPKPERGQLDARLRASSHGRYLDNCKRYYERWFPTVMQRLGIYQRTILEAIERGQYTMGVSDLGES